MKIIEDTGKLIIAQPEEADLEIVRAFYHEVIDGFKDMPIHPYWEKDLYPSPEQLKDLIEKGEFYAGLLNGEMVAGMALNHDCNESYREFEWPNGLTNEELYVIHMLAVVHKHSHKGFAGEMVQFAVKKGRADGMKAIRLDVLNENTPAIMLYESRGFKKMHTVKMFYVDCGWKDFLLYELEI